MKDTARKKVCNVMLCTIWFQLFLVMFQRLFGRFTEDTISVAVNTYTCPKMGRIL